MSFKEKVYGQTDTDHNSSITFSLRLSTVAVLDLGLISIASLGPRASTKVESHVNFTESQKVSQPYFFAILNREVS